MKWFFSPAVALMNRMGYSRKFALLWLIALAAILVVVYSLFAHLNKEVIVLRRELEGIALVAPISRAVQAVQQHRGYSAMYLAGSEDARDWHDTAEKTSTRNLDALEGALPRKLKEGESWGNIKANWERLQKEEFGMTPDDNLAAHTRLIYDLLIFEVAVADEYALTLDPQIDTYYLIDTTISKLPAVLEHIGQLRAHGASMLAAKRVTEAQKVRLYKIMGMLADVLEASEVNLDKTVRYNPALQKTLMPISGTIAEAASRVTGIVESDIFAGHFNQAPEDFFALTTLALDQSYRQINGSLLPAIEALLQARIAQAENVLYVSIGVAMLLLLVVGYFAAGIYFSITGNIRSLARSASIFAGGDMRERANLDTRDELGQVGDSFNEMADGFGALLEARRQAEESLQRTLAEQKEMSRKLEEAHSHLLQSEKMASIGQLAAGVAHEINNPIGYVYSNLGTLEKYMQDAIAMIEMYEYVEKLMTDDVALARLRSAKGKLDIAFLKEDLRALMSESKDGIIRVKNIVQNLKDFSHVDASDEWRFSDLHKGLDSTLNIVHNEIKYKANVVREYGDIPEVECLPSQLNQVFMNLLVNAAHAIEERGTITVHTGAVRTGRQGGEVWVEVADTGKGIAPEHMKKIFDPFFTTKPIGKGTGLGLSLSYGIVQKHGGRIEVQSEVGKGTAFRVWLPVERRLAGGRRREMVFLPGRRPDEPHGLQQEVLAARTHIHHCVCGSDVQLLQQPR